MHNFLTSVGQFSYSKPTESRGQSRHEGQCFSLLVSLA